MTRLVLPYPISTNRYKEEFVPKGWNRSVRYLTPAAKQYKRDVGWIAKQAGYRDPTSAPIALDFVLVAPQFRVKKDGTVIKNGIVMDLSNCLKVAEDALQGIVYVNDRQVKRITLEYGQPDGKGALIVDVSELAQPQQLTIPIAEPVMLGDMRADRLTF